MRINYKTLAAMAVHHDVELDRGRDEDGPFIHVCNCFASDRDSFLAAVDAKWPGKYHREYTGRMTVYLRPY